MEKIVLVEDCSRLITSKPVNGGSCGKIYQIDEQTYFKYLNEDFRSLNDNINMEVLDLLLAISKIEGTTHLVRPESIIRSSSLLFGYTTTIINAEKLGYAKKKTYLMDLISSLDRVKSDIIKLSDARVNTEDVNYENILYDGELHLLDFDLGMIDKYASTELLYLKTMFNIFDSILYVMIRGNGDNPILNDKNLANLYSKLYHFKSDEYEEYYRLLIQILESKINTPIATVGQIRHALRKTNGQL